MRNREKSTCLTVRLNVVKELKSIPTINHTFTEKIFTHAVCILALKKLKCMSASYPTRTKNKQIIEDVTNLKTTL